MNNDEQFEAIHYELSHKFISIPIQAQYNFRAGKRFSPYIALGGALALNTSNRITTTLFDTNDEIEDVIENELLNFYGGTPRKFNISAKMDIGFNYKLTEKVSLNTFVSGNMLLNPATKSTDFSMRHFNIGAGVGFSGSKEALALGGAYGINEQLSVSGTFHYESSGSYSSSDVAGGVGIQYSFK